MDPRLDHSIGRRGIPYLDWQDFPGKAWIRNQPNAGPYQTKKYAYYKSDKGSLQDNSSWTPGYTAINYTIIRFADVLLMAAEAEIEVGSPERAREYGKLCSRTRSKSCWFCYERCSTCCELCDHRISCGGWAKDDATREKVRFERKLELSGEGHRFYDLVRWSGAYGGTHQHLIMLRRVLNAYLTYEAPKIPSGAFTGTVIHRKSGQVASIPQGQIDLKPGILTQNPGF